MAIADVLDACNIDIRSFGAIEAVHPEYAHDAILSLEAAFPGTVKVVVSDIAPPLPVYRISSFLTGRHSAVRRAFRLLDRWKPTWAVGTPFCNRNDVSPWRDLLAHQDFPDTFRRLTRGYLMAPDCVKNTLPNKLTTAVEIVPSLPAAAIIIRGCTTLAEWLDTLPPGRRRSTKSRFRDLKRVSSEVVPIDQLRDTDIDLLRGTAVRASIGVDYFTHEYGKQLASRAPRAVSLVRVFVPSGMAGIALLVLASGRGYLKHLGIDYARAERYNVLSGVVRAGLLTALEARCDKLYLGRIRPSVSARYSPEIEPLDAAIYAPRLARLTFAYIEKRIRDTYVATAERNPSATSAD